MKKASSTSDLTNEKHLYHEMKQVHQQIAVAERSLSNLIKDFTNISVDMSRIETRQDELCLTLEDLSANESPAVSKCLSVLSEQIRDSLYYLTQHINVLQGKVIHSISYGVEDCKNVRKSLDECTSLRKMKVLAMQSKKKKRKSEMSIVGMTLKINELEKEMEAFERKRIKRLYAWLKLYIHSSLTYHVRGVEKLTKAYQALNLLDEDQHIEYFMRKLHTPCENERVDFVRWNSFHFLNSLKS